MLSSTDSGGNSSKLETTPAQNPPVGLGTLPLLASSIHGGDQLQPVCEAYHGEAGSLARFDKPQDAYPDAGLGHGALPDNAHAQASLGGALPLVPEALPRVASSLAVSENVLQPGAEGIGIASSSAGLGGVPRSAAITQLRWRQLATSAFCAPRVMNTRSLVMRTAVLLSTNQLLPSARLTCQAAFLQVLRAGAMSGRLLG